MTIDQLCLTDVRCFAGQHRFNIRPLTLLVGENSTGKSTVLGCLQAFAAFAQEQGKFSLTQYHPHEIGFNEDPYHMGSFRDIVRKSNPPCPEFKLRMELGSPGAHVVHEVVVQRSSRSADAHVVKSEWQFPDLNVRISSSEGFNTLSGNEVRVKKQDSKSGSAFHIQSSMGVHSLRDVHQLVFASTAREGFAKAAQGTESDKSELCAFLNRLYRPSEVDEPGLSPDLRTEFKSVAPLRSRPRRTYDPGVKGRLADEDSEFFDMADIYRTDPRRWKSLQADLVRFGNASGMFSGVKIRTLGRREDTADPVQVQVRARGSLANLMNTGFGVSQVLPILVRAAQASFHSVFLMQQPETHLHPRGQAELTSWFIDIIKARKEAGLGSCGFVIETHSDYLVDRARIEILNDRLDPGDLSLIYFEPEERTGRVNVFNFTFDDQANFVEEVPQSYHQFFLKETYDFMGIGP